LGEVEVVVEVDVNLVVEVVDEVEGVVKMNLILKQKESKMEIIINNEAYVKKSGQVLVDDVLQDSTFLVVGKVYLIRTVTMIYTGILKAQNKNELLLEKAAWIAETERWADSCKNETFKEVEPYFRDVVLFKGACLDITEITKPQLVQK